MLSRLISLLRRIPGVKWAITRLQSVPHSGNVDVTPVAADVSPAVSEDIAGATSAHLIDISTVPACDDVAITGAAPSAEDHTAISIMAESRPASPTAASGIGDGSRETPAEIEPVVVEKDSVSTIEIEIATADTPEPVISHDPAVDIPTSIESVDAEPVAVDVVIEPVDAAELVIGDDPLPALPTDAEPVVTEGASPSSVDVASTPVDAPALVVNDNRFPDVIVDVEPAAAPVTAVAVAHCSADAASVVADIEPAPALVCPSRENRSAPKVRSRAAEPADRAALIRQRWAETGIRMWNPRLHGTGEATLNIQGSVGLLPPAPGETMPRYEKLEFRTLDGQIVCEGIIVEAPAQASHRSFTRLAEPGKPDRVREPARERQAALA